VYIRQASIVSIHIPISADNCVGYKFYTFEYGFFCLFLFLDEPVICIYIYSKYDTYILNCRGHVFHVHATRPEIQRQIHENEHKPNKSIHKNILDQRFPTFLPHGTLIPTYI